MAEEARKNKRQGREMQCGKRIEKQERSLHWTSDLFFSSKSFLLFCFTNSSLQCHSSYSSTIKFSDEREQRFGIEQPGCGIEGA